MLIESFVREFSRHDAVVLYILTQPFDGGANPDAVVLDFLQTLSLDASKMKNLPFIYFLPQNIDLNMLRVLYASVDAFVLPSHGEGWGRPHVEAMSMGLPIISTFWSGPTAYMTNQNSYPLRIKGLIPADAPDTMFKGHKWADPDRDHLRELMRHVMSHPDEARQKGIQARKDMVDKFCPACINTILVAHLHRITKRLYAAHPSLYYHVNTTLESFTAESPDFFH